MPVPANFKEFQIMVGQPGPYSQSMRYERLIECGHDFNCLVKHAPYFIENNMKNVVVQTWKDEDGDDVYLPRVQEKYYGGEMRYLPAVVNDAQEYPVTFVFFEKGLQYKADQDFSPEFRRSANEAIRGLVNAIEGRWLKIYDVYTGIGFDGVYYTKIEQDPRFKRRDDDLVIFTITFKINGNPVDAPFTQDDIHPWEERKKPTDLNGPINDKQNKG